MAKSLDVNALRSALSQPARTSDGSGWALGTVNIEGAGFTDLGEELKKYRHVRYLHAASNALGSLEEPPAEDAEAPAEPTAHALDALTGMTSLLAIDLSNNGVLTMPSGLVLPNVQSCNMAGNRLTAVPANKDSMPRLVSLNVSENALGDLEGLDGMSTLKSLNVSKNTVLATLAGMGALPALEQVVASECSIADTTGLEGASASLKSLDLSQNQIASLEGLEAAANSLSGLQTLNLSGNAVESLDEVARLSALAGLQSVDLTGNPCSEVDEWRVEFVLRVPGPSILDGEQVTPEERRAARDLKAQREEEARLAAEAAAAAEAEEGEGDE